MEIVFDSAKFIELASQNPLMIVWFLFINGGWIVMLIMTLFAGYQMRLLGKMRKYITSFEHVLLAIDIPKDSEQSPKAMEQVFATISGAHSPINKVDQYWNGVVQLSFSYEIISIDGYIQFLIRTPKIFRDLVEAAVYAHYPDAEITEVYDYTEGIPTNYPNDQLNVWGAEMVLTDNEALPIRTYESFEDKLTQEFKDPLAGVLEVMSRIQKNEQVWIQIITRPTENVAWVKKSLAHAYKLAGKKTDAATNRTWYSAILDMLFNLPNWFLWFRTDTDTKKNNQIDFRIMNLTPGQRDQIESIEKKAEKIGYICKIRIMYLSPHEQYQSKRVVSSVIGGYKQFANLTSNSLKPNNRTKTQAYYFNVKNRVNARRRRIVKNYKNCSWFSGSRFYILNTEELATLYHFPSLTVTTPLVKRTETKKSNAPAQLPASSELPTEENTEDRLRKQLVNLQLDNNYYESLYAKSKSKRSHQPQKQALVMEEKKQNIPENLPISQ